MSTRYRGRAGKPRPKRIKIPEDISISRPRPPRIIQTAPIFKLADETFLHILSCFKYISLRHDTLPIPYAYGSPSITEEYAERQLALRTLTQTCRALRQKFLPWYYERVEACVPTSSSPQWYRTLGELLYSRSRSLINSPHVTQSVRVISVSITRYQIEWILPTFSACVASLPNLHTIEIYYAHSDIATAIKNAFKGYLLPSVHTVVLPAVAHNILRCCPNVRDVTCSGDGDRAYMLCAAIVAKCPKVERVSWSGIPEKSWKRLAKTRPNIKHIQLTTSSLSDWNRWMIFCMKDLEEFKRLSTIEVLYRHDSTYREAPNPGVGDKIMAEVVALLKKSQLEGAKYARIRVVKVISFVRGEYDILSDTTQVAEVWGE